LPVGLLFILSVDKGLQLIKKAISTIGPNGYRYIGMLFVLLGILINEWLFPHFARDLSRRMQLWSFNIIFLVIGMMLVFHRNTFINILEAVSTKHFCRFRNILILISSGCLLIFATPYPHGKAGQMGAVLRGQSILSGGQPASMVEASIKIFSEITDQTKVLALNDAWLRAFSNIDLDGSYPVLGLPPFEDLTGATEKLLNTFDLILVSDSWATPGYSVSTQLELRYFLHVKPFLEKAVKGGWSVTEIENYGRIYKRRKY